MQKYVFGHMRTAKAQIRLRIRAVWSGPELSANRIIGHYWMYWMGANAWMRLCACVGWIWICAFCACWKTHLAWRGPYGTWGLHYISVQKESAQIYPLFSQNLHRKFSWRQIDNFLIFFFSENRLSSQETIYVNYQSQVLTIGKINNEKYLLFC